MLSPRWIKIARDVRLHKARTVLAILAIVVGLLAAGSVLDAWSLVRRATVEQYAASNPPAMTIRVDSVDAALLDTVRRLPFVRAVRARRVVGISVRGASGTTSGSLVVLDDFTDTRIGALHLEDGHWPAHDSITVERSTLAFAGAALGESIEVRAGNADARSFIVSGIARDVGIPPGWMDHDVTFFGTRETLARLGFDRSLNQIQLTLRDATRDIAVARRAARDVAALLEKSGHPVRAIDVPVPGRHPHAGQMDSLLITQGIFGVLATLMSAFLVINLIGAMLAGQTREIGIMKTIGGRGGQIAALYLVFSASLGIVSAAISLPTAAIIGRKYGEFSAQLLNFDLTSTRIPWWALLAQILTAVLLPLLAASIPVWRACSISVVAALRGATLDAGSPSTRSQNSSMRAFPAPIALGLLMVGRRRARTAMAIATLAIGGAVFLGARSLRNAVIGAVDGAYASYRYDFSLRLTEAHAVDSIEQSIRKLDGVRGAEAWTHASAEIAFADSTRGNAFTIVGLPSDSRLIQPRMMSGRWLASTDERRLVVSNRLSASEPTLAPGAVVNIRIGERIEPWTVVGVADLGISGEAYALRNALAALTGRNEATTVVIDAGERTTPGRIDALRRVRDGLRSTPLEVRSGQLVDAGRDAIEDHLVMVVSFLGGMAQVMILVGALGLASTMSIAVIERTREIGVLRAIGATPATIQLIVHVEALVIALLSSVLALTLSIPIGRALGVVFGRIMLPVSTDLLPDITSMVEWVVIVLVMSALASAWPARRAAATSVREALAYE